MRHRLLLATVATAAVTAAVLPAHAAKTPVLDGKKTKSLSFSLTSSPQSNDSNLVTDLTDLAVQTPLSRPDMGACPASRCLSYSFVYRPAKHVRPGPFSVRIAWTVPGQDYDLYVIEDGADIGHCGASAGTSEVVVITTPLKGKLYKVVVDQYRAGPDTITGKVAFPASDKVGSSVPEPPVFPTNCGLS